MLELPVLQPLPQNRPCCQPELAVQLRLGQGWEAKRVALAGLQGTAFPEQQALREMQDARGEHAFLEDPGALHEWRAGDIRGANVRVDDGKGAFVVDAVLAGEV